MGEYTITILNFIAIQAIVASGLNVIVGYAGQISLGHAAFFGIGAYASALLTTKAGLTFWAALPLVVLITAAIGMVLGMPSLRLREDFLAVTTIGINFIVESVFLYVPFFGGALGIGGIPSVYLFGTRLKGVLFLYMLAFRRDWRSPGGSPGAGRGWPVSPSGRRRQPPPARGCRRCASS